MANQLSPGILTRELDLTAIVPQISTTDGAVIGEFQWGPVEEVAFLSSEDLLVESFGKPSETTFLSFFTAANFLAYGNKLQLVRVLEPRIVSPDLDAISSVNGTDTNINESAVLSGGFNSSDGRRLLRETVVGSDTASAITAFNDRRAVKNSDDFEDQEANNLLNDDNLGHFLGKYPGQQGDSLKVSICPSTAAFGGSLPNTNTILTLGNVDYTLDGVDANNSTIAGNTAAATVVDFNLYVKVGDNVRLFPAPDTTDNYTVSALSVDGLTLTVTPANTAQPSLPGVGSNLRQLNTTLVETDIDTSTFIVPGTDLTLGTETKVISNIQDSGKLLTVSSAYTDTAVLTAFIIPNSYSWEYAGSFDGPPGTSDYATTVAPNSNDELHLVVVDEGGIFTGDQGTVIETWPFLSKATDAKAVGINNYFASVINRSSSYIYILKNNSDFSAFTGLASSKSAASPFSGGQLVTAQLTDGSDGASLTPTPASLITGYNIFSNADTFNVSLMMMGAPTGISETVDTYTTIIENAINIAEDRKDFVLFFSPALPDINNASDTDAQKAQKVVTRRNSIKSTSYAFMDSGWKYQYDKYNDLFRYVPLNGDTAGVCVRSDIDRDPWFSPAGFNRGQVRNVVRLPFSPGKPERDTLYKNAINPITTFTGEGTYLFGDKTLLAKPNAFDRINVRRLFIILEKTISSAALTTLFEFNDQFTRQQFVNLVEPFLRQVQGRSGISDFRVICDETNNTPQIIDTNNFVCSVFVKPARSINFITLNFVSVNSGVDFEEVVGAV